MSEVDDETLLARAYLSRVAEPACIPLWWEVRECGPVDTVRRIRNHSAPQDVMAACGARADHVDAHADLDAAARHGITLVVPESDEWPHFAVSALEAAGARRARAYFGGDRTRAEGGESVPPLALWAKAASGPASLESLSSLGVASVGIVGSRAATSYGEQVAAELAYGLAGQGVDVISGGAYGIDAAAHRGALAAGGHTVLVSAGGLDRSYPPSHDRLFAAVAESGLLLSESPPGAAPARHRFLTRNRLIAALSSGTVVVEAAARSGARNTATHSRRIGRPVMAVPGPVTSASSAGCHALLADPDQPAILVATWQDVYAVVRGAAADVDEVGRPAMAGPEPTARELLQVLLDDLGDIARQVFDSLPPRRAVTVDRLARLSGLEPRAVMRALPALESAGLAEPSDGQYRVGPLVRRAAGEAARIAREQPHQRLPNQAP